MTLLLTNKVVHAKKNFLDIIKRKVQVNSAEICTVNSNCTSNNCLIGPNGFGACACSLGNGNKECDFGEACKNNNDCKDGTCSNSICVCAGNNKGLCFGGDPCSSNVDCSSGVCAVNRICTNENQIPII
ncbi:16290_t:CDS:2 [Cetraspora pellucida]|uniref:16290_t:CDS:1 n=1 Tax=Cetraspora pellucida TaxID=1433469 RepID=A0ACA9K1N9_9GLOM|nr:16290_t:CDS:2 [Cetraspora pellucida]